LRLIWEPDALRDLGTAAEWSAPQASAVVDAMERMADRGFSLERPLAGTSLRYWPVPPLAVVYRIISNQLHVEAVVDMRRLRERP
jgi:plasmid stabilization system protein ParE